MFSVSISPGFCRLSTKVCVVWMTPLPGRDHWEKWVQSSLLQPIFLPLPQICAPNPKQKGDWNMLGSIGSQSHQQTPTCAENPTGETLKLPYQMDSPVSYPKHWMSLFANLKCNTEFLESWGNKFVELQGNFMTVNAKALILPLWNRIPPDPNYWDNMKTGQHHYPSAPAPDLCSFLSYPTLYWFYYPEIIFCFPTIPISNHLFETTSSSQNFNYQY